VLLCHNCKINKLFNNGATSGAGTVYPPGAPEFTPVISVLCVALFFYCVVFCRSLFVLFYFGHCVVGPSLDGFCLPLFVCSHPSSN